MFKQIKGENMSKFVFVFCYFIQFAFGEIIMPGTKNPVDGSYKRLAQQRGDCVVIAVQPFLRYLNKSDKLLVNIFIILHNRIYNFMQRFVVK